jgi:KUP system potassium uptake protein
MLSALGVVYGDIGTSPLYAMREAMHALGHGPVQPSDVLGVLSLIVWTLLIVVTVKYLVFVLRADNQGEGGILALMALVRPTERQVTRRGAMIVAMGMFGAALLYGDGVITPAISVLGAIEGLQVAWPSSDRFVLPLTLVVLVGLFAVQSKGTAAVGRWFGPITLIWFIVLAVSGIWNIAARPDVIYALAPWHAVMFLIERHAVALPVVGGVFLCATGGEALYADMGHFGAVPIRRAWFYIVLPGLLLNYFGQGALLLEHPNTIAEGHPFFDLVPHVVVLPLVLLATMAAVIASQALISGAFSLTSQAIQLGYLPRMSIVHTSEHESGQIYVPFINSLLLIACLMLVVAFGSSTALAAAYGIAVTLTMIITTVLFFIWATSRAGWSIPAAIAVCLPLITIELGFAVANMSKFMDGGWFPLALGSGIYTVMATWHLGRQLMSDRLHDKTVQLDVFRRVLTEDHVHRTEGVAVFMTADPSRAPHALYRNYLHNRVVHSVNLLVTVRTEDAPYVRGPERMQAVEVGDGFWNITIKYGFMESPDVPKSMRESNALGVPWDEDSATWFLGRDNVVHNAMSPIAAWRIKIFAFLARNAEQAWAFYKIPHSQVIEIGMQVDL